MNISTIDTPRTFRSARRFIKPAPTQQMQLEFDFKLFFGAASVVVPAEVIEDFNSHRPRPSRIRVATDSASEGGGSTSARHVAAGAAHEGSQGGEDSDYYFAQGARKMALTLIRSSIEDAVRLSKMAAAPGGLACASADLVEELRESVAWVKELNVGRVTFRDACWIISPSLPCRRLAQSILDDPALALARLAKAQELHARERAEQARDSARYTATADLPQSCAGREDALMPGGNTDGDDDSDPYAHHDEPAAAGPRL